jgi:probable blue pigment (indigoidine) exporter
VTATSPSAPFSRTLDLALTAIAPAIWGSVYLVTTQFLPAEHPLTVSLLRALPAGCLLLLLVRRLPFGVWWLRVAIVGGLNFSLFWALLFVSAYRLPGGVAATVGAVQPLIVVALERLLMGRRSAARRCSPVSRG